MKLKITILCLLFLLCGTASFAQTGIDSTNYQQSLEFLQGDGVYETGVMVFLTGLKQSIWSNFGLFIGDAQALAAIFMVIFFAIKSYEMMVGDKQLEIMPLLRPFGLVMIIIWWGAFTQMVAYPTDLVESQTSQMFNSEQANVNALRFQRAGLMIAVADSLKGKRYMVRAGLGCGHQHHQRGHFLGRLAPAGTQEPAGSPDAIALYRSVGAAGHLDIKDRRLRHLYDPDHLLQYPGHSWPFLGRDEHIACLPR